MEYHADHEPRGGWRGAFDPELWRQGVVTGTAGAILMAIVACAIALACDTTGHDWYATAKVTAADLLIAAGFDEDALTEYRTADGTIETVSRYGLTVTLEARWAREDILAAAWDGAGIGALCGLGGALLCLVLIHRSWSGDRSRNLGGRLAAVQRPTAGERFATLPARLQSTSHPSGTPASASVTAPASSASPSPRQPDSGAPIESKSLSSGDEATAPDARKQRRRDPGRWV